MDIKEYLEYNFGKNNQNKENYTIDKDLGQAVVILVQSLVNTTQFTHKQLVAYSKLKPLKIFEKYIIELEKHLKDINRKNAKEIIDMADKVSKMIQLNSFSGRDEFLMDDIRGNGRFFNRRSGR